jgi:tetratricopeptide (TPR) repeat protein
MRNDPMSTNARAEATVMPSAVGIVIIVATIAVFFAKETSPVRADDNSVFKAEIRALSTDWERIKFQIKDRDDQENQIAVLTEHAAEISQKYQRQPEAMIWLGIIISEQASMANDNGSPIKALGFAKRARDILETAEKIDPVALDAGAPTVLGVLYSRVPGFPLGFGDKGKALHYFQEAIKSAPNGLDANSFYGNFLYDQGEYSEAEKVLKHALTLPPLSDRPIWDRRQRLLIRQLLARIRSKAQR